MANDPSDPVAPAAGRPEGTPQRGDGEQAAHPPAAPTGDAELRGSPAGPQHRADADADADAVAAAGEPGERTAGAHHHGPSADATVHLYRPSGQPGPGESRQDTVPEGWPAADRGAAGGWWPGSAPGTGQESPSGQPWAGPGAPQPVQGWYAPYGGSRPPEHPIGAPLYPQPGNGDPRYAGQGGGFGPPQPGVRYPDGPPPNGRGGSSRRGGLLALGLVAMLLTGVIGGVVGNTLAATGRNGSVGVLGEPLPGLDEAPAPTTPVEAVAARVLPSVVQLRVEGPNSSGEGSAMVLSADGLLLTNNHVVEAAAQTGTVTAVFQDGRTVPALIVGRDPSSDLAVIRAQNVSGLLPVELGNSDSLRVGQQVVAFGAPLGLGGTVTTGIISAVDRAVNVGEETGANTPTVLNALQTDAAINPGNSGGPLVDMEGRVVGINSAIATTGAQGGSIGVGFSIPVNQARRVAEELERTGRASRAVLGVTVADDPQQAGAVIRDVVPGGAADLAGIRRNDVVLRFGDQRISTGTDLQAAVGSRAPGEVVEVQLADRTVQATLTSAPN